MISKELLSEVLYLEIYSVKQVHGANFIRYEFDAIGERRDSSINIYELAFDVLFEFAFKNHYYLNVDKTSTEVWKDNVLVYTAVSRMKPSESKSYISVFIASEWILNQLKEIK